MLPLNVDERPVSPELRCNVPVCVSACTGQSCEGQNWSHHCFSFAALVSGAHAGTEQSNAPVGMRMGDGFQPD